MKKILLTLAVCLVATIGVFAQAPAPSIIVDNQSSCDIYVEFIGTTSTNCTSPMPASTSGIMQLPVGRHDFDNTGNIPGTFANGEMFYQVILYAWDPANPDYCSIGGTNGTTYSACSARVINSNVDLSDNSGGSCACSQTVGTVDWQTSGGLILKVY